MERLLRDKKAIFLFTFPTFLLFTVIVVLPIFFSIHYSTLEWDGFSQGTFVGLANYKSLFVNNTDGFLQSIINSLILALISVGIQLPISLLLALIIARGVRGENFFRTVYFIPVIISTVVIGQLWMKIYNSDYGMLNTVLRAAGLDQYTKPWLADTHTALAAVFIAMLWQYIGYHMLLMYAGAKSISPDIYEAARIDGASEAQMALHVTIPLMKPILCVCVIFAVTGSFKAFDLIYVMTGGGPLHSTEVPTTLMYTTIFSRYQYGYGSAMAIFIIAECLIFTLVIQKLFHQNAEG
ncbi:MAG: sugar ABC transporter permease [Oscillospiraceae bacterium]|jgi:raffinose/stachyose/melibiose transport system permease protein|nr:sugar ABC transporter permease [Oscillospiraceae bacterium]